MVAAKLSESPIHLIGKSMGGGIAAVYASRHPHHVALVTLICPTGNTMVTTTILLRFDGRSTAVRLLIKGH